MHTATRRLIRWVAVLLVRWLPLRLLRALERAVDHEILIREMGRIRRSFAGGSQQRRVGDE
jgi:hypothetical protein